TPAEKISIKALSKVLIGLQVIQMFQGRHFSVLADANDDTSWTEEKYIPDGSIFDGPETVKGFLIQVLGKFALLSTAGMKTYEYDILNQKMESSRRQVFEKSVFIILNL